MKKTEHSWRVEWKTAHHPNEWRPYSRFKGYPSEALDSYEEAKKPPGVIDVRIVRRTVVTEETREVIDPETLKGRI